VRACEHFAEMSASLYETIHTEYAGAAHSLLSLEEDNLRACLDKKRPARPKRDNEQLSPTGYIASYLPQILVFADRAHNGIRAAEAGREACRGIGDVLGEANCRQGFGRLYLAEETPEVAFEEFRAALEVHVEIDDRLGVGACLGYMGRAASMAENPRRQCYCLKRR
jgi:hypothetical protein